MTDNELLTRIDALERRLDTLDATSAITRTLFTLAHTLDYGDNEGWVDCFVQDAVFQMVEVSETDRVTKVNHTSRDALAAFIPGHSHAPEHFHKHLVADPVITVTGDTATCESYMTRIDKGDNGPFLWSFGRYLDEFVRSDDGKWRVSKRVIEAESRFAPVKDEDIGAK